ncbi:hypothetical protein SAMN04489761_0605 [Tenacibaculum sp. MAR_2009_124]|uniref:nuclear transport factor 2 family protein n=1 Tax=Tenacibaculum sp. MAR_2009_124 TaxID=1250059 RepID=UPI0008976E27|nr:nuclear transport factor 2 family protein [Tenacibaculum sp. MAR_2009_124]SEB42063.1 hypothetical protein SAMN04489761_0605 [Tenacibaculum sp. MAR_2009_124]
MKKQLISIFGIVLFLVSCNAEKKNNNDSEKQVTKTIERSEADKLAVESQKTLDIANTFMTAMSKGDMEEMASLMHDDMIWQNAGDSNLPWMGPWKGKKTILEEFLPAFEAGFITKKWEPTDSFAKGNTAAYFGQMIGQLKHSGKKTKEFTYALRVKIKDGKIILWNWFEDSFEVSKAYHK